MELWQCLEFYRQECEHSLFHNRNSFSTESGGTYCNDHVSSSFPGLSKGVLWQLKLLPRVDTTSQFLKPTADTKPYFNGPGVIKRIVT